MEFHMCTSTVLVLAGNLILNYKICTKQRAEFKESSLEIGTQANNCFLVPVLFKLIGYYPTIHHVHFFLTLHSFDD